MSGGAGLSMEEGVGAGVVNGKKKAHRRLRERLVITTLIYSNDR